jgi:hypothetical protein
MKITGSNIAALNFGFMMNFILNFELFHTSHSSGFRILTSPPHPSLRVYVR